MNENVKRLKERYENDSFDFGFEEIETAFESNPDQLNSLIWMEETGGEPKIVSYFPQEREVWIMDTSKESPIGRRSLCYDEKARKERKKNAPDMSAVEEADLHGLEILDEEKYYWLQDRFKLDEKTSSWLKTPKEIRDLGGAIFAERRYNRVFTFHNGAQSYYSSRGWRGLLKIKI